jgi:SNF2 family DNA or RNA helicase
LEDLWSLMQLLNPGLLGDRRRFQERYVGPIAAGDANRAAALRARLKPFVLRREKRAVAPELPPRTETVLHVELSPAERAAYDVVRAAARRDVLARLQEGGGVLAALEALLRLRQACCHGGLLPSGDKQAPSAKVSLLVEALSESVSEGHKALVFSQWTSFLDLIAPALAAAGLTYLRLDGATVDRQGVVAAFQAEDGPPILLMSLKAGGVGLNLTRADHVLLTDPWWNPAAEDQAADRAHRIGQDRPVLVQRLVALGTVEERILALQERKRQLAALALAGEGGGGAAGLTADDLLALLD